MISSTRPYLPTLRCPTRRHRTPIPTSIPVPGVCVAVHSHAQWPLVVFSTYHSVHVVAEAARSVGVVVDLVIADEAHTLAGQPRREFQVVLSDEFLARTRVFLTATQVVAGAADDDVDAAGLSMDDAALFGPVAYRLDFADAIARGLLADYQVLVVESAGQRLLPDPVAALAAAAGQGVSSVLSFHGRVAKARAFAAALDGLVLADGRIVVARAVAGIDPTQQREHALALLAGARPDRLVVISSARCLSAGIDIPAVDGVLFADPKNSDVDVIQSVGRALRTTPGKRVGLVMIPVCVPAGLDDDSALSTGAFAAVWRILRGLRSMDRRLAAELEMISRQPSRRGVPDGSWRDPRVHFDVPSIADPARLYARVVDFVSPAWDSTLREVLQFAAEHGHVRIRRSTRLGEWCERQRRAYRSGMLAPERAGRLSALPGWAWDPAAQRWLEQWAQVLAVADECGQLTVDDPQTAQRALHRPEPKSRVNTIGRWCAAQRQLARRGELGSWQLCKLDEIPGWSREAISAEDANAVDLLGEYVAWKGDANPPADLIEDDVPLGQWLNTVRGRRATGHLGQPLLDEVTIVCPSSEDGALRWYRGARLWLLGLEALRQFVAREGHCRPPYSHVEQLSDFPLPLYDWCTRQRHLYRRGQLIAARACKLETVEGWQWERQPTPRVLLDIGDTRHGQRTGYVKGCRCEDCTTANRLKEVQCTARAVAGGPTTDLVDAAPAREHLAVLSAHGAAQKSLARACGLKVKTIVQVLSGETKRVLPETDVAIRALGLAAVQAAAAPGTRVDAAPTWELLDDMIARGWPNSWIARELGLGNQLQLSRNTVTAANAEKVAALARRLGDRTLPPKRWRQAVASLDDVLAAEAASGDCDTSAVQWARSLLDQGYQIQRVAQRSSLPVEMVTAMASSRFDEARTPSWGCSAMRTQGADAEIEQFELVEVAS